MLCHSMIHVRSQGQCDGVKDGLTLWAIAAHRTQAGLAAKRPEGSHRDALFPVRQYHPIFTNTGMHHVDAIDAVRAGTDARDQGGQLRAEINTLNLSVHRWIEARAG
jgi:hypothetical protein